MAGSEPVCVLPDLRTSTPQRRAGYPDGIRKNAADDTSSPVQRIQQEWLQDYEKRIQEYKKLFLIQSAIKQKTFNQQISKLSDIRNRMNQYTQSYNRIAEQLNRHAEQLRRPR